MVFILTLHEQRNNNRGCSHLTCELATTLEPSLLQAHTNKERALFLRETFSESIGNAEGRGYYWKLNISHSCILCTLLENTLANNYHFYPQVPKPALNLKASFLKQSLRSMRILIGPKMPSFNVYISNSACAWL